jgi:hypothetical protein
MKALSFRAALLSGQVSLVLIQLYERHHKIADLCYRQELRRKERQWLVGASVFSLCAMGMFFIFFMKQIQNGLWWLALGSVMFIVEYLICLKWYDIIKERRSYPDAEHDKNRDKEFITAYWVLERRWPVSNRRGCVKSFCGLSEQGIRTLVDLYLVNYARDCRVIGEKLLTPASTTQTTLHSSLDGLRELLNNFRITYDAFADFGLVQMEAYYFDKARTMPLLSDKLDDWDPEYLFTIKNVA